MRRCGGFDIPLAPPVMQLRSKNFCRNSPRPATSPTPEQADSAFSILLGFSSGRTQNPPVLWLTESACSCPEQPLSATHGRQRYNTLDFARKVVCHETAGFFGFFLPRRACPPLDASRQGSAAAFGNHRQGNSVPFGFPSQHGALAPIGNPEPKESPSLWNPSSF